MSEDLILGDCVQVMAAMPEACIDTIVTDPPYGLEFMGKAWDSFKGTGSSSLMHSPKDEGRTFTNESGHMWDNTKALPRYTAGVRGQAFHQSWATEALRILKPGAHLLAFGGPRTYHRLTCGIEDAGFEIRDCLSWLFGSGFPKSLDVSKAIDKAAGAEREVESSYQRSGRSARIMGTETTITRDITAPATDLARQWEGWGTALKPGWEIAIVAQKPLPPETERDIIVENLRQLEAQLWSLLPAKVAEKSFGFSRSEFDAVCASARWTADEQSSTRAALSALTATSLFVTAMASCLSTVRSWSDILAESCAEMSTSTTETKSSTTTDWRTLRSCLSELTPRTIIEAAIARPGSWWLALPAARSLNAELANIASTLAPFVPAPATSQAEGLGLVPNWEPCVVARKPLIGTVAANVTKHGTGALNIDACRIGTDEIAAHGGGVNGDRVYGNGKGVPAIEAGANPHIGRWPANVALDEEAAAMLDEQSGVSSERERVLLRNGDRASEGWGLDATSTGTTYGDSGGASRFFYTAKASRSEREAWGRMTLPAERRTDGRATEHDTGHLRTSERVNNHPTVKPLALMEWLIKLVTPPGGLILDPFCGSGSTLVAAKRLNVRAIGIEQDERSVEIARQRLAAQYEVNLL